MLSGKSCDASVMHDPGVNLPHVTAVIGNRRSQSKWIGCQSPNHSSSGVHELDRARGEGLKTFGFVPMIQKNSPSVTLRPLCIAGVGVLVGAVLGLFIAHSRGR